MSAARRVVRILVPLGLAASTLWIGPVPADAVGAPAMLRDVNLMPIGSSPSGTVAVGGEVFFAATDGIHGTELWKSGGAGATMVADIDPGTGSSNPLGLTNIGGVLYFSAADG